MNKKTGRKVRLNVNELLQSVQEAYASLVGLPMVIIDSQQTSLTSISNIDPFSQCLLTSEREEIKQVMRQRWKSYLQLTAPAVIDLTFQGVKGLVAPVVVGGQSQALIWAGPFVIQNRKAQINETEDGTKQKKFSANTPAHSLSSIRSKLYMMEKMASVCAKLLENELLKQEYRKPVRLLQRAVKSNSFPSIPIQTYLRMLQQLHPSIHITAYAKRMNRQRFVIQKFVSQEEKQSWLQPVYTIHHPIIHRLIQEGEPLYLENISAKLKLGDWTDRNELKTLFVYPIKQNGIVSGAIFVGSKEKIRFSKEIKEKGYLLVKLMEACLSHEQLVCTKQHFLGLKKLNELSASIREKEHSDEILQLAANAALDLMDGEQSVIVLQQYNEQKIIADSQTSHKKSDLSYYLEYVRKHYLHNEPMHACMVPRSIEMGRMMVIECPFYINKHVQGVFAIYVTQHEQIEEREVCLALLTNMMAIHLQKLLPSSEDKSLSVDQAVFSQVLTPRELDVLKYVVEGLSNRDIAEQLYISIHTVKNHITNIFRKLEVKDRSQLIAKVYQLNFEKNIL
jgi:DNA-binding CsgD family transcriptional regulator/ligand-binding sensor protein